MDPSEDTTADDDEDIPGATREAEPYEEAPATGKFAPEADNPPPPPDRSL